MGTMLSSSELRVMAVVWRNKTASAKLIADTLAEEVGYSTSATYTLIGRCIKKGALRREDPGYNCYPLVTQEEVQAAETDDLLDRLFDGSVDKLFSALIGRKKVTEADADRLRKMIDEIE